MASFGRFVNSRSFMTSNVLKSGAHNVHADKAAKLWKNVTFFVALPAICLSMANGYISHTAHHEERIEFVPYDYLRIRNKKFPWGDGDHTLFHNKHLNALPSGYED